MKANELRIGNKVDLYGSVATVERFDFNETAPKGLAVDKGKPITLTDEWMLKFGGLKDEHGSVFVYMDKEYDLRFYLTNGFIQLCKGHSCPLSNYTHVRSVHLFQNLAFALTNKELKIKL